MSVLPFQEWLDAIHCVPGQVMSAVDDDGNRVTCTRLENETWLVEPEVKDD